MEEGREGRKESGNGGSVGESEMQGGSEKKREEGRDGRSQGREAVWEGEMEGVREETQCGRY